MNNHPDSIDILFITAAILGVTLFIFIPLWLPAFAEWVASIFRKLGQFRNNMIWKIEDAKSAFSSKRRKKQIMIDSQIIVSVQGEPVQKTTSDGRILEFIKVKMKSGDVKELYKNVDFTYLWFWADNHSPAPDNTTDVIRTLLDHYRIDHATTIK